MRKVTIDSGTNITQVRLYVGQWEVYRKSDSTGLLIQRETIHVMDDSSRVAVIDSPTGGSAIGSEVQLLRYQYSNHLGTATLEVDNSGSIISYEEYYAYGGTSFQAGRSSAEVSLKRYRYIGKELDNESGFYYMGARYYVSWLCRWIAVDALESKYAGMSPYNYGFNNPITWIDPTGMGSEKKDGGWYSDPQGKAHFLNGVHFPDEFNALHLKGKFFGVIQGEYNADGTHTKPHYISNAQSKPQHTAAKPTTPAKHAPAPAKTSAPTPAEQFGTGFKQGAVENLQSLKDAVTTPTGLATLAGGAALIYFIPGLGEVAMVATVGYMAYKAATAAENLHEGNYHEAGRGAGSLTVDAAVILATEGAGKLGAGSKTEEAVNTVDAAKKGWKVGEPIMNLTAKGNVPTWSTVRQRFWKNEALLNGSTYSESNSLRLQKGLAPQRLNPSTGLTESMELHHIIPQRNGGLFDFIKVWPDEHRELDPFRR